MSRRAAMAAACSIGCSAASVPEGLPDEATERAPVDDYERQLIEERQRPTSVTRILNPNGEISILGPVGQFRTICVRTCDGYYFPMSPDSSSADFDRDQKNCESACPGTDMQLYYQGAVGEESEAMVSAGTGAPYASLPTAYLYATRRCRARKAAAAIR